MSEVQEPPSLPVFIVTGVNFTVEVKLDEMNAELDFMHQQFEAASRAIETLKNVREDDSCRIMMNPDSRGENPKAGPTVLVHLKDSDPEKALPIPTYLCFANIGLYPEANVHKIDFDKRLAEQKKLLANNKKLADQHEAELKAFDQFQREQQAQNPPRKPAKKVIKKKSTSREKGVDSKRGN